MPSWILISSASREFSDRAHSCNHWFFYDATWHIYTYLHIRPKTSRGLGRGYRESLLETTRKVTTIAPKTSQAERNRCDSKNIVWAFVFGSRTAPICALCHHALGAHTPTAHSTAISGFLCRVALQFFCQTIHQVIWLSPGTLLWPYICVYRHIHRDMYSWILWSSVSCAFPYCTHSSNTCLFPCIFLMRCEIYI